MLAEKARLGGHVSDIQSLGSRRMAVEENAGSPHTGVSHQSRCQLARGGCTRVGTDGESKVSEHLSRE
jgi:hypothetical protein